MKKKVAVLFLFFLLFSLISVAKAQISSEDPFGINVSASELADKEALKQKSSDYLKTEWKKFFSNTTVVGPLLKTYDKAKPVLNPLFKYTLGIESDISWLFLLSLVIWILIVTYVFRLTSAAMAYSLFSETTKSIIAWGMVLAVSLTGISRFFAEIIIKSINVFMSTWWSQLITTVLLIVIIIILAMLSKKVKEIAKKLKETREKADEQANRQTLQTAADAAGQTFSDGAGI